MLSAYVYPIFLAQQIQAQQLAWHNQTLLAKWKGRKLKTFFLDILHLSDKTLSNSAGTGMITAAYTAE